jgi:alkanesulfonate monooxygenase SsuD/methylene tetrahydromethanopterin reductase-like flavin-dependent oxidoreductase (luciferase family)
VFVNKFEIGLVLPVFQFDPERTTPRWAEIREVCTRAEQLDFDTVWVPDELLWMSEGEPPTGVWDCVSIAGAVAASTSRIKVGTWVMSALHRNPGIIAKTAATLDEISGGRFVFGLGAGHAGPGQAAHAFGLPEDKIAARFREALDIIVPLVRTGRADFQGTYHAAHDLVQQPVGPRPNAIPLLIGGNRLTGQRMAARYADIWSSFATESSYVDEFLPRMASFLAVCEEEGRDPATIGRDAGVLVHPLEPAGASREYLCGSAAEIADSLHAFRDAGFTQVDMMVEPGTVEAFETAAPVVELLRAG